MFTGEQIRYSPSEAGVLSKEVQPRSADRFARASLATPPAVSDEDVLVVDDRANLRPAQAVENRLSRMLSDTSLPVSHLQMRGLLRSR